MRRPSLRFQDYQAFGNLKLGYLMLAGKRVEREESPRSSPQPRPNPKV